MNDKTKTFGGLTLDEFKKFQSLKPTQRRAYLHQINKIYILDGKKKK